MKHVSSAAEAFGDKEDVQFPRAVVVDMGRENDTDEDVRAFRLWDRQGRPTPFLARGFTYLTLRER